ncbi:hypothetical protein ADUPG1_000047 [Aduncisulcus paluster]|uniref:Uncharacterized protein n=1 Tax=Aduncisulcus paluster TaxID=2918883 RepID=A0ABQ5K4H8_9EUKA|nr:hypothetical protein ADUPG1_000047 [Aduncisulcus paluster]
MADQTEKSMYAQLYERYKEDLLRDIASLAEGTDPELIRMNKESESFAEKRRHISMLKFFYEVQRARNMLESDLGGIERDLQQSYIFNKELTLQKIDIKRSDSIEEMKGYLKPYEKAIPKEDLPMLSLPEIPIRKRKASSDIVLDQSKFSIDE